MSRVLVLLSLHRKSKKLADESAVHANEIENLIESIRGDVSHVLANVLDNTSSMEKTQTTSVKAKNEFLKTVENTQEIVKCIQSIYEMSKSENLKVIEIKDLMVQSSDFVENSTASIQENTSNILEESHLVEEIFDHLQSLTKMTSEIQKLTAEYSKGFKYTEEIKAYVTKSQKILSDISKTSDIKSMSRGNCEKILGSAFKEYGYFESITVFNQTGDTIGIAIDPALHDETLYTNFAHRPYFIESIKGKEYVSSPYISTDTYNYCIALALPIYHDQKIIGVLMADLHLG